jgi:RHS repeat-associated protein
LTNSQGVVTDTYSYDAFGELLSSTGTTVNAFLYTGEQKDDAAGLYYLRARYYNPANGRFLTSDRYQGTLELPQTQHKYAYVENDPVNKTDPLGLYSRRQGTGIHGEIGRYYIDRHGDYFVDTLGSAPNAGFPPMDHSGGLGAYNRMIRSGMGYRLFVDLRHYGTGDVYEIKPLTDYGLLAAYPEAWAYTQVLNHFEGDAGPWDLGGTTFPAILLILGSQWSSTATLQVFGPPLMPPGVIIYSENFLRDISNLKIVKVAQKYGYLLIKRLQQLAPRMIQAYQRAGLAATQDRIALTAYTKF